VGALVRFFCLLVGAFMFMTRYNASCVLFIITAGFHVGPAVLRIRIDVFEIVVLMGIVIVAASIFYPNIRPIVRGIGVSAVVLSGILIAIGAGLIDPHSKSDLGVKAWFFQLAMWFVSGVALIMTTKEQPPSSEGGN
ncbi:MAG: hypothetical protein RLN85_07555, partial [Pseudomonadales bacterium]